MCVKNGGTLKRFAGAKMSPSPVSDWPEILTAAEVAVRLRISKATVLRLAKRGAIRPLPLTGRRMFTAAAVRAYLGS